MPQMTYIRKAAHLICDQAKQASDQGDFETASTKRDEAHNMLQEQGFIPIGGTHRSVYRLPNRNYVVKFATGIADENRNKHELNHWQEAPPAVRQHLAPIDEEKSDTNNHQYIVQEYIDDNDVDQATVTALEDKLERNGFRINAIDTSNVGVRPNTKTTNGEILYNGNGTVVLYGYTTS